MENIVIIDPTPNGIGVFYNVTSDYIRSGILNGSAILIQNSNAAFNVSFICIETSRHFNIGMFLYYKRMLISLIVTIEFIIKITEMQYRQYETKIIIVKFLSSTY